MQSTFLIGLFEFLTYLVPGSIIALAILLVYRKYYSKKIPIDITNQWIYYSILLSISIILGVVNHTLSSSVFGGIQKVTNYEGRLENVMSTFPEYITLKTKVETLIDSSHKSHLTNYSLYRYTYTYVKEKSSSEIFRIERLIALSMFCRNVFFALVILYFSFILYMSNKKIGFWYQAMILAVLIIIEISLLKAYDEFRITSINGVFRTFLIINGA